MKSYVIRRGHPDEFLDYQAFLNIIKKPKWIDRLYFVQTYNSSTKFNKIITNDSINNFYDKSLKNAFEKIKYYQLQKLKVY